MVVDARSRPPAGPARPAAAARRCGTNRWVWSSIVGRPAASHARASATRSRREVGTVRDRPTRWFRAAPVMRADEPAPSLSSASEPAALIGGRHPVAEVPLPESADALATRRRPSARRASSAGSGARAVAATAALACGHKRHVALPALDRDVPAAGDDRGPRPRASTRIIGCNAPCSSGTSAKPSGASCASHAAATSLHPTLPTTRSNGASSDRAGVAVAREHGDVRVAERVEPRRRAGRDFLVDVDRHDPTGRPDEFREHRGEVPGTGTDLEHRHAGREREQIGLDREELRRRRGAGRAARRARDTIRPRAHGRGRAAPATTRRRPRGARPPWCASHR